MRSSDNLEWSLPNNGTDPVTVMFSGVTEGGNWDYFAVYDLADDSFIGVAQGDLTGQVVIGNGNGVIVVFVSDGSVNYAGGSFDGSCVASVSGCMTVGDCNYNSAANTDDPTLCTGLPATNADCAGDCLTGYVSVDGSCVASVSGCMTVGDCNYNSAANTDDPTLCTGLPATNADCAGDCLTGYVSVDGACVAVCFWLYD